MTLFECYVERWLPQDAEHKWTLWEWASVDIDRVIAIGKGESHDCEECAIFHLDTGQHLVIRHKYQEAIEKVRRLKGPKEPDGSAPPVMFGNFPAAAKTGSLFNQIFGWATTQPGFDPLTKQIFDELRELLGVGK